MPRKGRLWGNCGNISFADLRAALGTIAFSAYEPSAQDLQNALGRPLTHMQEALHELSAVLPPPGADVESHIANLASGIVPIAPIARNASEARGRVRQGGVNRGGV